MTSERFLRGDGRVLMGCAAEALCLRFVNTVAWRKNENAGGASALR